MKFDWSRNVNRSKVSGSIAEIFCSLFFLLLAFFFLPFLALLPFCALSDIVLAAVVAPFVIRPDYGRLWLLFFLKKKQKTFLFVFQRKKMCKKMWQLFQILKHLNLISSNFDDAWRLFLLIETFRAVNVSNVGDTWIFGKKNKFQVLFGWSL